MNFEANLRELHTKALELKALRWSMDSEELADKVLQWTSDQLAKLLTEQCDSLMRDCERTVELEKKRHAQAKAHLDKVEKKLKSGEWAEECAH